MSELQISAELRCRRCGGRLEASAKVYFDITAAEARPSGPLAITGLEFSTLNDSYSGHPVAMEHEINVSCADCGAEPDVEIAGAAAERTDFAGALTNRDQQGEADAQI